MGSSGWMGERGALRGLFTPLPGGAAQQLLFVAGYKQHVDPSISTEFLAAMGHSLATMVPPGVYRR